MREIFWGDSSQWAAKPTEKGVLLSLTVRNNSSLIMTNETHTQRTLPRRRALFRGSFRNFLCTSLMTDPANPSASIKALAAGRSQRLVIQTATCRCSSGLRLVAARDFVFSSITPTPSANGPMTALRQLASSTRDRMKRLNAAGPWWI